MALVAVTVAALGGAGYGASWLLLGDALRLSEVTVLGAQITDPRAVVDAADIGGKSLLTLDANAAARRVAALPGVRSVRVHRDWPDGAIIDITEHQGWGYWQASGQRRVIDIDGRVREQARPPADGAPTIFEVGPPPAEGASVAPDPDTVRLVDRLLGDGTLERLAAGAASFVFRRDRGLTVQIEGGPDVVFGDSQNYGFKVAAWRELLERIQSERLEVREIDLRFGRRLVLR